MANRNTPNRKAAKPTQSSTPPETQAAQAGAQAQPPVSPSTWPSLIWEALKAFRNPWVVAAAALVLLASSIILDYAGIEKRQLIRKLVGLKTEEQVPETEAAQSAKYAAFIAAARKANKPYLIEAVTMLFDIEDSHGPTANERKVSWRNIYTIRALKDIGKTDRVFLEAYRSDIAKSVLHWNGTEEERWISPTGRSYDVNMEIKEGELRTFTTGVDITYELPLPPNRTGFNGKIPLGQNEDYAAYPNLQDADYICNITIVVRSKTTPLQPVRDDPAVTLTQNRDLQFSGAKFSPVVPERNGWHTLSASWSYVTPGQEVGILFQWK
jgi:hypothetical protein